MFNGNWLIMLNDVQWWWNTSLECLLSDRLRGPPRWSTALSLHWNSFDLRVPYYACLISSFLQSRCVFIIYTRLINSDLKMWVPPDSAWDNTHKSWGVFRLCPSFCNLHQGLDTSWSSNIINLHFLLLHGAFRVWLGWYACPLVARPRSSAGLDSQFPTPRHGSPASEVPKRDFQQGVSRTGRPNHQKSWDSLIFGLDRLAMELYGIIFQLFNLVQESWLLTAETIKFGGL